MLKFLATTENEKILKSEEPIYNRGKVVKKASGNCYSQFPDIEIYQSNLVRNRRHSDYEQQRSELEVDQSEPSVEG